MKPRGGARAGAGRKPIGPESRTIRARVAPHHEQALLLAGNGGISNGIRMLAERHWRLIHGHMKVDQVKPGGVQSPNYIGKPKV